MEKSFLGYGLRAMALGHIQSLAYVTIGLLAESREGDPVAAEPEKTKSWKWYATDSLPEGIFLPSKKVIENWLKGKMYTD
ncbi:hypothetical protein L0Y69_01175 [bacterium]|nr:hypothetical protein [bacterium]